VVFFDHDVSKKGMGFSVALPKASDKDRQIFFMVQGWCIGFYLEHCIMHLLSDALILV
jgi:hypothetical protein